MFKLQEHEKDYLTVTTNNVHFKPPKRLKQFKLVKLVNEVGLVVSMKLTQNLYIDEPPKEPCVKLLHEYFKENPEEYKEFYNKMKMNIKRLESDEVDMKLARQLKEVRKHTEYFASFSKPGDKPVSKKHVEPESDPRIIYKKRPPVSRKSSEIMIDEFTPAPKEKSPLNIELKKLMKNNRIGYVPQICDKDGKPIRRG